MKRELLSGDEAVARAARDAGVALGTGYPGTPSTEILETFSALGGKAQWAPNEKVALEVGLGAAFGGARTLVTMKHVGVNVAADPLFTATYTGVSGALVLVSADDPGMASSQNEQDNRHYATAAGIPMLEPADSQDAYDFTLAAFELSAKWKMPVMLRITTRVCHSKTLVRVQGSGVRVQPKAPSFERDIQGRVMIPAYARPAHKRLRQKLAEIQSWNETSSLNRRSSEPLQSKIQNPTSKIPLGLIASGISVVHAREAAPEAAVLQLGMTYPLPMDLIRGFVEKCERCIVIEEGDAYLADAIRAAGIAVESKPEMYRFGELSVGRVQRILNRDTSAEPAPPKGKPPQLCPGCPYRSVYTILRDMGCIVAGDIGCYTLGVLPPFTAMDTCVCMGASVTVGLGLRHVLPEEQARRVVSIIGDSTFAHSGLNGLVEMVYNPPVTGHVVIILDNGTTAMTGQQEHPGTGRSLEHEPTGKLVMEKVAAGIGVRHVDVVDAVSDPAGFETLLKQRLASNDTAVIISRRPCILAAGKIREYGKAAAEKMAACEACVAAAIDK